MVVGVTSMSREETVSGVHDGPTVGIVGLGLIGGSLAQALLARDVRVLGCTLDAEDADAAAQAGVESFGNIDALAAALPADGIVVLCVPVSVIKAVGDALMARVPETVLVVHAAGLQRADAIGFGDAARVRVIGTHPLAGSHATGFAAARPDLFIGATVWAESRADTETRTRVERLWKLAGVRDVTYATAEAHDAHMAWISHLPQLAAIALAGALAECGVPVHQGGPGLRDTTRLAASPFPLWRDLLAAAPPQTGAALTALAASLDRLGDALARGDDQALAQLWGRARDWRSAPNPIEHVQRPAPAEDLMHDLSTAGVGGPRW